MKVKLLGARGSFPHIGPHMVRYGGNTSCVEITGSDGTALLLDAGTGVRNASAAVDPGLRRLDILITHFHMDHLQGLGFFAPLFNPAIEVHIWGPPSTTLSLHRRLARYLSPPLFPICIRDFSCHRLVLHDAPRGKFEIGGLTVESDLVCHPGPTMGFRISEGDSSVAYLPDHEAVLGAASLDPQWMSGVALAEGVDILLHDSQYDEEEYAQRVGWGHSTLRQSLALARASDAKRLITFHHDPNHDDDRLDAMINEAARDAAPVAIKGGMEGDVFDL